MKKLYIFASIFILPILAKAESPKTICLQSFEIPPLITNNLPAQGAASYALKELFKKAGYKLDIKIFPISRAQDLKMDDPTIQGFFPYFDITKQHENKLTLSNIVHKADWVIVENKEKAIHWKNTRDLLKYKGSQVRHRSFIPLATKLLHDNKGQVEEANSELSHLLKLANKRIDYIFTNAQTYKYLMATEPRLAKYNNSLQINRKIAGMNSYAVAFKNNQTGNEVLADFNRVANPTEFQKLLKSYFKELHMEH